MHIKTLDYKDFEHVISCSDPDTGLEAIIAIHDTTLGPSLGGTRMWPYPNKEAALIDVLRLARGMTFKAAAAALNVGGGKAVIIGDPKKDKTEEMLRMYGKFIDTLKGQYITAEDVGTTQNDMDVIRKETDHVVGISGASGDPSPFTAYGTYLGIKTAVKEVFGTDELSGKTIAVQGIGSVGYQLCKLLYKEGAQLIVSDLDNTKINKAKSEFEAMVPTTKEIFEVECDVFAPCAMGAVINDTTINKLHCKIVAGAANNVLAEDKHGTVLKELGILYIPDYVINAGGLINVADELNGYNEFSVLKKIRNIPITIKNILALAKAKHISTNAAADQFVQDRLSSVGVTRGTGL